MTLTLKVGGIFSVGRRMEVPNASSGPQATAPQKRSLTDKLRNVINRISETYLSSFLQFSIFSGRSGIGMSSHRRSILI